MKINFTPRHQRWRQLSSRRALEKDQKEKSVTIAAIIKEQLVILGSLVLAVGIISTHAYYAVFSIKYQTLDLPTFHMVYYGLLILLDAPYLLAPYIIAVAWLCFDAYTSQMNWSRFIRIRMPLTYLVILVLFVVTFPLARRAGTKKAQADSQEATSTLPKIVYMELANGTKYELGDRYRLLEIDSTYTTIFKPLDVNETSTLPNIKRISKSQINVIETVW
jgi:hypothetical protein